MSVGMQDNSSSKQPRINLIFDFDGTLTHRDTTAVLPEARGNHIFQGKPVSQIWSEVVEAYSKDFSAHTIKYRPNKEERKTIREETDWLESLKTIEQASFDRAVNRGVFSQVQKDDIVRAASSAIDDEKVTLRPGWADILQSVAAQNGRMSLVSIVSVNWSRTFIRSILSRAAGDRDRPLFNIIQSMTIRANEIPGIPGAQAPLLADISNRQLPVRTNGDKRREMLSVIERNNEPGTRVVYVGDSTTDLSCLLEAEVGICIRDERMSSGQRELAETLDRLGVPVHPLTRDGLDSLTRSDQWQKALWFARDFVQVKEVLLPYL